MVFNQASLVLCALFLSVYANPVNNGSNAVSTYIQKIPSDLAYYFQTPTNPLQFEKCFDDLGCFHTTDYFDLLYRPFSLVPNDRSDINVTFCLYTKHSSRVQDSCPHHIQVGDSKSVVDSEFKASRKTVVIVHGFIDNGLLPWVMLMKYRLLKLDDFNVIVVDWSSGNKFPYTQAAANTWVVGGELYLLLNYLSSNFSLSLEDVHIVGHSLGSHIAGYTGSRFNGKLGRITGLDPAGPFFEHLPANTRLDPTDAMFVDVIHTDGKVLLPSPSGYGTLEPFGHVDFYANGGILQPGCDNIVKVAVTSVLISIVGSFQEGRRQFVACSHNKAVQYFIDSLTPECEFLAHECVDYEKYNHGKCPSCGQDGTQCVRMGYFAYLSFKNRTTAMARSGATSRQFYLTTGEAPTRSVYHYIIRIWIENTKQQTEQSGTLYMAFRGAQSLGETQINENTVTFEAGKNYSFVIASPCLLGPVKEISFRWDSSSLLRWLYTKDLYVKKILVEPMDIEKENWRQGNITTAYVRNQPISSGSTVILKIP